MGARIRWKSCVRGGTPGPGTGTRRMHGYALLFCAATVLLLVGACGQGEGGQPTAQTSPAQPSPIPVSTPAPQAPAAPLSWTHFAPPPAPEITPELVDQGAELYAKNCASCHGDHGGADGVCAAFLIPHPRDFTRGVFRFKTTQSGELPTDQDIFRTISLGLHATGMPPWQFLLSEQERWALVAYIKTLTPVFEDDEPGEPVELGTEPQQLTPEQLARGKELFLKGCATCHGEQGYGDGPATKTKQMQDIYGNPISPRNFHKAPTFKRGHTLRDIALTIHTGNDGTPMPAFSPVFSQEDIWSIAGYIQQFADPSLQGGGTPAAATKGEHLGTPDVTIELTERKWKYHPDRIEVRQGQVVRIHFQPTDNGLGVGHGFAIDGYDKSTFINGAMVQRPKSVTFVADKPGTFTFYCATQCSTGSLHPKMNGTFVVTPIAN